MSNRLALLVALAGAATCCTSTVLAQANGRAVFVLNNVSDQVTSYAMDATGALAFVGNFPVADGPQAVSLSPNGRWLAVGHGTASDTTEVLEILEVHPDASLTVALSTTVPDSPLDLAWLNDDALLVMDTGLSGPNWARTYAWNPQVPSFIQVDAEQTGSFSTAVVVHPTLPVVYCQDSTGNTVTWFTFDAVGELTFAGQLATGGIYPLGPSITHAGDHLYFGGGISSGGNKILGFDAAAAGALAPTPGSPFTSAGASPAYTAISTDDAYLYVGHGTDATVRAFAIQPNGAISATGFLFDVGLQGTIGDLETIGDHLLITDESSAIDGITGLYVFDIQPDGSLVLNAPIYVTGGVRPERIASWDPPAGPVGDIDGNGVVDFNDLLLLLAAWGPCPGTCAADLDGSGDVGFGDLLLLLANWS